MRKANNKDSPLYACDYIYQFSLRLDDVSAVIITKRCKIKIFLSIIPGQKNRAVQDEVNVGKTIHYYFFSAYIINTNKHNLPPTRFVG